MATNSDMSSGMGYQILVASLFFGYIGTSGGLIFFNKWLMDEGRYPYSVPLVTGHMVGTFASMAATFWVRPSLFPSMATLMSQSREQVREVLRWLILISLLFSVQLCLTNMAYLESSVAFLQMMKEGNVVIVYLFSLALALDDFSPKKAAIICCVIGATSLTITGELDFSMAGFAIQGCSQFMESSKLVLQAIVLGSLKFDPLSYNLIVSPISLTLLGSFLVFIAAFHMEGHLAIPTSEEVLHWAPMLILNALVAVSLNVIMALYIKHTSAIALVLTGICKDSFIVLGDHFFLGESLTGMQMMGFAIQLCSIFVWSQVKAAENEAKQQKKEETKPINDIEDPTEAKKAAEYGAVEKQ